MRTLENSPQKDINNFYHTLIDYEADESTDDQLAFDLNYFRRKPKIVDILTKQAKQFMKTLPSYRSDEEIDVIVRLVSSFSNFKWKETVVEI